MEPKALVESMCNLPLNLRGKPQLRNAEFSRPYWPVLQRWAGYLADKGFDPESQLSTDDFAGHLAHNVNLSMKAIEALGAYAQIADRLGEKVEATKYRALASAPRTTTVSTAPEAIAVRAACAINVVPS